MNPVYINGLGNISPLAASPAELLAGAGKLAAGEPLEAGDFSVPSEFNLGVSPSKVRRAPRYAKLATAVAGQAWEDSGLAEGQEETGTVFLSGYGPVATNLVFEDAVLDGVPSLASPTAFSYTVPNSCLGQACIAYGFRGPSTMLLGGDPVEYAALLLAEGKAEHVLCGAVEEWDADLRSSFRAAGQLSGENVVDGAVMLLLSCRPGEKNYGKVTDFASASLPAYPYVFPLGQEEQRESVRRMAEVLSDISGGQAPGAVLTSRNGSAFDEVEAEALKAVFGEDCRCLDGKKYFGEALAAGYLENIALGACLLQQAKAGAPFGGALLATGVDVHGNYLAAQLEA